MLCNLQIRLLLILLLAGFGVGTTLSCSGTNFSGSAAKQPNKSEQEDNDNDDVELEENDGDGLIAGTDAECFLNDTNEYNVVLVFDNSGSQKTTDPGRVRAEGALGFVEKVVEITDKYDSFVLNTAVITFTSQASVGSNRWQKLSSMTRNMVESDINAATSSPNGNTAYAPPLNSAASLFQEKGTSVTKKGDRNFVVFLTDGMPGDKVNTINQAANTLVTNYGAAIIAVAAGGNLKAEGENLVSTLALPEHGIVDKDHTGVYRRAVTGEDMKSTWDAIFSIIMMCD